MNQSGERIDHQNDSVMAAAAKAQARAESARRVRQAEAEERRRLDAAREERGRVAAEIAAALEKNPGQIVAAPLFVTPPVDLLCGILGDGGDGLKTATAVGILQDQHKLREERQGLIGRVEHSKRPACVEAAAAAELPPAVKFFHRVIELMLDGFVVRTTFAEGRFRVFVEKDGLQGLAQLTPFLGTAVDEAALELLELAYERWKLERDKQSRAGDGSPPKG